MSAPGDPGTYIGPDGNWYDSSGTLIASGSNPPPSTIYGTGTPLKSPTGAPITAAGGGAFETGTDPNLTKVAFPAPTPTPTTPTAPPSPSAPDQTAIFGAMPGIPKPPPFSYAAFQGPAPFSAPSGQDVLSADPGYGFRLAQGQQALEQSAAARGVLNTGGTLQDVLNYGQNAASQEYDNAFNRAYGTYQTNFSDALNAWLANAGNAFQTYQTNYNTQYQNPYLAAWGQYQQGVNNQNQLFQQKYQTATA